MEHTESRGYWPNIIRVGRPDCVYDMRTKYMSNLEEFQRALNDRKRTGIQLDKDIEIIGEIIIED